MTAWVFLDRCRPNTTHCHTTILITPHLYQLEKCQRQLTELYQQRALDYLVDFKAIECFPLFRIFPSALPRASCHIEAKN